MIEIVENGLTHPKHNIMHAQQTSRQKAQYFHHGAFPGKNLFWIQQKIFLQKKSKFLVEFRF